MKKLLAILLALVLVLSMAALAGCGDNKDSSTDSPEKADAVAPEATIVGVWDTSINLANAVSNTMPDEYKELGEALGKATIEANYTFKFDEGEKFTITLDTDSLVKSFAGLRPVFAEYFNKLFAEGLEGTGYTVDEALAAQGLTMDSLLDNAIKSGTDAMIKAGGAAENTGKYKIENDRIYLVESTKEFDDDCYLEFDLVNSKTLRITKIAGVDNDFAGMDDTLPWTLIKR